MMRGWKHKTFEMTKKNIFIFIFLVVLSVHLTGIQLSQETLQNITKPLLIPLLLIYFLSQTKTAVSSLKKWIILALFFSWGGDVLLMFQGENEIFFLLGLSSFLIAHIFYIIFFHKVRIKENVKSNPWLLVVVVVYYAALITLLYSHLADMRAPVLVYGIVISFMFMLAMHMLFVKNRTAGKWMMIGALLFIISDSILAINKFYQPFEIAGVLIMLTYGLAQFFIAEGASDYIRAVKAN